MEMHNMKRSENPVWQKQNFQTVIKVTGEVKSALASDLFLWFTGLFRK